MTHFLTKALRCVLRVSFLCCLVTSGIAQQPAKRSYTLPGDAAEQSLKRFSEQSGRALLVGTEVVRNIRTNPVKGEFTPAEALATMLAGTGLVASEDPKNGAFIIRRETTAEKNGDSRRAPATTADSAENRASGLTPAMVNTGAPTRAVGEGGEQVLQLDAFEVQMTQDKGYHTPYSGSALKTNESIMKVPQSITVITRDLIDDIASYDLSDMLNYIGVGNFQQGDSAYIRGNNANLNTDGAGDGSPSMSPDSVTIDSITVVRGPIAVLYGGNSSITGAVVRQTRTPLDRRQTTVKGHLDEWGFHRVEVDHTGPLGSVGEAKFTYRVDLAHQAGDSFLRNWKNDKDVFFGVVQMKYKDTTLRLNAQYQDAKRNYHRNNIATPDGLPWIEAGRDESFFDKDSPIKEKTQQLRMAWIQRFSSSWAFTAYGTYSRYRYGPHSTLLADRIDYQRGVVRLFARRNNGGVQSYTAGGDLNGNYRIWKRDFRTSLGFTAWNSRRNPYDHFANPDFGEQNAHIGTPVRSSATALGFDRLEIPLNNVRSAMDRLINIPSEQYRIPPTAQIGTLVDTTESNVYLQQNIEVIPNRLIITGAVSKIYNQANSENYTAVPPTTFTNTVQENRNNRNLHRFGFVLNVTKNVALYGVETTNVVFINSSSRTADGSFIPPRDGQMREAGVKASLFDDRVSLTAAIYTTYYTNWAVSRTGAVIPEYGFNVFDLIRDSYIKGWDFSLAMRPVRDWQVMFNLTEQDPRVQATNSPLPSSNRGSWSVFTSYKLKGDVLGKFRVGGGANRFRKRLTGASQLVLPSGQAGSSLLPGGQYYLKDGTMTTAFVEFSATRRLSLRLNVNNVFDEVMVVGAQHWAAIDPSQPRTFSLIATYRY